MPSIRKSLLFSSISGYTVNFLALGLIIIVARLLTPQELGVYAIASAFILFANEFKSLGTGTYLIRTKDITPESIKKATGLMVIISWGFGSIIFLASTRIADFYQIDEISNLLKLLSFSFWVAPFISVPKSVFTRNFEFGKLLIINITAQIALVIFTLIFIFLGYSYYSLAYAAIVHNVVELALVLYFKPKNIPSLPIFSGLSEIVKFGSLITLANVFRRLSLSAPDLIIGKMGTPTNVAIFSRGLGFLDFLVKTIQQGINPVVLPYLSKEIREDQNIEHAYLKATALLGSLVWPAVLVAGLVSYPIIIFLFGNQWGDSAPIARILCIWAFFLSIHTHSYSLLIATQNEKHLLIREMLFFVLNIIAIGVSFNYGLEGIAFSMSLISVLNFLYTSVLLNKLVGIGYLAFLQKVWPIMSLLGVILLEMIAMDYIIGFSSQTPIVSLSIVTPVTIISWFIGIKVLDLDIYQEINRASKAVFRKNETHK